MASTLQPGEHSYRSLINHLLHQYMDDHVFTALARALEKADLEKARSIAEVGKLLAQAGIWLEELPIEYCQTVELDEKQQAAVDFVINKM